jgi:hypothetical protein
MRRGRDRIDVVADASRDRRGCRHLAGWRGIAAGELLQLGQEPSTGG